MILFMPELQAEEGKPRTISKKLKVFGFHSMNSRDVQKIKYFKNKKNIRI